MGLAPFHRRLGMGFTAMLILAYGPLQWTFPWWLWLWSVLCLDWWRLFPDPDGRRR